MLVSGESKESCDLDLEGIHAGYPSLRIIFTPDYRKVYNHTPQKSANEECTRNPKYL